MDDLEIKNQLLEQVQSKLQTKILELKKAMDDAQQEANAHIGAMASRYDTFKQEAQALRDGFALQVQRTSESLAVVQQFAARRPESKRSDKVEFGAAVITNEEAYFVSTGLLQDPVEVAGVAYECVGPNAPLIEKLRKAGIGGTAEVGGRKLTVQRVF